MLSDVFYSGGELLFEELALLGNLLTFLQKVLRSTLYRGGQNVGLFGPTLLFVGRTFIARVHQSRHLIIKAKRTLRYRMNTYASNPDSQLNKKSVLFLITHLYLGHERLQESFHSQRADLQALGIPFEVDVGRVDGRHVLRGSEK